MNDGLPFAVLLRDPIKTLRLAGILVGLGLAFGLFLPGYLQYQLGTFFSEQIMKKLPTDIQKRIHEDDAQKRALNDDLEQIGKAVTSTKGSEDEFLKISRLLQTQASIEKRLKNWKAPLYIAPVFPDPLMIVWPLCYISFMFLIFIMRPTSEPKISVADRAVIFLGALLFYRWPTWIRNSPFIRDHDRKIFAGTNIDVDPFSFLVQEAQAFLLCFLLVEIWMRWVSYFIEWNVKLSTYNSSPVSHEAARQLSRSFVRQFIHWQICSVLLAVAFVPYTYFFWRYVVDIGDDRYVVQAIEMQTLWVLSWLFISLPVLLTWYKWQALQSFKAGQKVEKTEDVTDEKKDEAETSFDSPIGMVNVLLSAVAALFAFVSPILKALVHF